MSTHLKLKYTRASLIPVENGVPDVLNSQYTGLIEAIQSYENHTYKRGEHLPNIAKRYHGTTTTYWIIAAYNGIIHPLDLEPGTVIRIPSLQDIDQYLNLVSSRVGQLVEL